jgi:two-component system sensor kinase
MSSFVESAVADIVYEHPGRTIEFTVGDLPACNADRERLAQALRNLVANAVKFTEPRPVARIEVGSLPRAESEPGMVTYFVKDNGVGFDMKYAGKLFQPFERLHAVHEFAGVGVGLSLVKRIVERLGGRVWAEGAVDEGATFYFTLEEADATGSTD